MISKKRAPLSADRTIQQVYDDINEIINAVNQSASESRSSAKGKAGDIRVVKSNATNKYILEAYTKDGWAQVELKFEKKE
tara:strand:+ start:281 stop:520 length:240 start_codon:yes stop_codon:yes gene_type:complete